MQAVNQLSRPSGSIVIGSNTSYSQTRQAQVAKPSYVRYRYITAVIVYLVVAVGLISACYFDNGYLLKETISCMAIIGLLLVVRLFGKEVDNRLPEPKSKA